MNFDSVVKWSNYHSFRHWFISTTQYLILFSLCKTLNLIPIASRRINVLKLGKRKRGTAYFHSAVNLIYAFLYLNLLLIFIYVFAINHYIHFLMYMSSNYVYEAIFCTTLCFPLKLVKCLPLFCLTFHLEIWLWQDKPGAFCD